MAHFTPLLGSQTRRPSTFNAPLYELDNYLSGLTTATETITPLTVVGSPAATITLSSIPQTYKHLALTFKMIAAGGVGTLIALRVNGSAAGPGGYYFTRLRSRTTLVATNVTNLTGWNFFPSGTFRVLLMNYTDAVKDKLIFARGVYQQSSTIETWQTGGAFVFGPAAITSLVFACEDAGNILANSWYSLEGMK